jgi:hypothetical protein
MPSDNFIRGFLNVLAPFPIKKPLPEILLSDSGPTIQLFNLQKYFNISGPNKPQDLISGAMFNAMRVNIMSCAWSSIV